ncbi:MAG: diguanylate cyclase, partial [Moraxella osloensis]|nr:diguanylate cyclase [Moraxella osloensis]
MLLHWRIDDAIDAISTHLFAGVAGTLAVALVMPDGVSVVEQLKIQLLGVLVIGFFVMGLSWLFLSLINRVMPLRVSESDEVIGLNVSEHKASSSVLDLILSMNHQAVTRDFSRRIMAEPYSEAEPIAIFYNSVTQAFNQLNAEKEALLEETFRMANYDSLTGLAKRRVMINVLNQVIARLDREALSHAVMFIDLDGFKAVNDNQGHEAGDLLLREVAQRIETCIGKSDLASRFGGDEFVVLLEDIKNENHAAMVADKLIATIKEPVVLQNAKTVQVGASIGICVFGRANLPTTADEILKFADEAMYAAKRRGKGQWLVC